MPTYRELADNAALLTTIAREMKLAGLPVDQARREAHRQRLIGERDAAAERFRKHTGFAGQFQAVGTNIPGLNEMDEDVGQAEHDTEFNIDSNPALVNVFFGPRGYALKPEKLSARTGKPTLDKGVLRELLLHTDKAVAAAALYLLQYRQANTTETRYIGQGFVGEPGAYGLPVLRSTGKHHPTFGVCAAETLRFTCQGGAHQMQKDTWGKVDGKVKLIRPGTRDIFRTPPGWVWLESDYSALELREFALYANIREWMERFRLGGDVHKYNTALALQLPYESIDKTQRDSGKTLTFGGIAYGGKPATVRSQVLDKLPKLTLAFVEDFQRNLFKAIPRIPEYHKEAVREAYALGYTPLATGDRVWWKFPGFTNPKTGETEPFGEPKSTEILNKRMQRTAARVINEAMPKVRACLPDPRLGFLVLQLHDALHCIVREDQVHKVAPQIKAAMEARLTWEDREIDLTVEQKVGPSWGELGDLK
jgi:DNA polymerase I-like protein with 3'-5' exonuclease and polymerase domains